MKQMNRVAVILLLLLSWLAVRPALAKGPTGKITISGPELARPVEITDPEILNDFSPWSDSFFDGQQDPGNAPRPLTQPYGVFFWLPDEDGGESVVYTFYYYPNPAGGQGLIYLPGRGEPWYWENVGTILRGGLDGSWLFASESWDSAMQGALPDNRAAAGQALAESTEPATMWSALRAGNWLSWLALFAAGFVSGGIAWSRIGQALASQPHSAGKPSPRNA